MHQRMTQSLRSTAGGVTVISRVFVKQKRIKKRSKEVPVSLWVHCTGQALRIISDIGDPSLEFVRAHKIQDPFFREPSSNGGS